MEKTALEKGERIFTTDEPPTHPGHVIIDGRRVRKKPGKKCFKVGCDQNSGVDHFGTYHPRGCESNDTSGAGNGDGDGHE